MTKNNSIFQDSVYNIDNYEDGKFKTFYYVPHSMEVCKIDNKTPSEYKKDANFPGGIAEQIDENDLERSIREVMMLKPNLVTKFTNFKNSSEYARNGIVVSNFKEAYTYGGATFDMLVYLTLVHNLFQLQYSVSKLNASGQDLISLEASVFSGQQFWRDESIPTESELGDEEQNSHEEEPKPKTMSSLLIKKIVDEKRMKKYLAEDMEEIKNNMLYIKKFFKTKEEKTIKKITNVLINHHYLFYYHILHGMEKIQDYYCDKQNKNNFRAIQDYLNHFTNKYEGIVIKENGFHVNQALIKPNGCDIEEPQYNDYQEFNKVHEPTIDERYLTPRHVQLIEKVYGDKTFNNFRITQSSGQSTRIGYDSLKW